MHKILSLFFLINSFFLWGQTDYSDSWEDFFSYHNVKDLQHTDTHIIAVSDNAVFFYDKQTTTYEKISSVNGLIGSTTSAFYFDTVQNLLVIGYEDGTLEIIDANREITLKPDIKNFSVIGSKRINHIKANGSILYLSTDFGIVIFDSEELEYKETLYIADASTEVVVHETEILNNTIYAATENGIYFASLDEAFLNDYNNWTHFQTNDLSNIIAFNNELYVSIAHFFYKFENNNSLQLLNTQPTTIYDITVSNDNLVIIDKRRARIYDENLQQTGEVHAADVPNYYFDPHTAYIYQNDLYIATKNFGILKTPIADMSSFEEIHPQGPVNNKPFSITVKDKNLWVVYGGYDSSFAPSEKEMGACHFNGENWVHIPFGPEAIPIKTLVQTTIDPSHENRVYISSYGYGIVILENDTFVTHWDDQNSGLEGFDTTYSPIRVGGTVLDDEGNLWVATAHVENRLKRYNPNTNTWTNHPLVYNDLYGVNNIIIDKSGNKWFGSVTAGLVADKNGIKSAVFNTETTTGNMPDAYVKSLAVDNANRVWIGLKHGLTTFNSSASFFDLASYETKPIVLASGEDDNFGVALLAEQQVNSICVDGADNKWFGTLNGVLHTNSSGQETLSNFTTVNSPLPSDVIHTIQFDASTGKIYFATAKGIVAYNSNISPYGEHLEEVYAYPNPVKKQHDFVTIDGRNGTHIPNGTNVKIVDIAGKLVFETNVKEGQELYGGKVVWNKTNLSGRKVASGIYVVLLTTKDNSETSMTKIAIIN